MAAVDYAAVVQQLYISYFGRPADYYALQNFETQLAAINAPTDFKELSLVAQRGTNPALTAIVNSFNSSDESIALYGKGTSDIELSKFVNAIYNNVLNRDADNSGRDYWIGEIKAGRLTKANAAAAITQGALDNTSDQGLLDGATVAKKAAVAADFTASLDNTGKINAFSGDVAAAAARELLHGVSGTTDVTAFHASVIASIDKMVFDAAGSATLTNGTDHLDAGVFNAGLVYNPAGTDRINSLQNEDVLTGRSQTVDNVLNATLGNSNDNGGTTVTPTLKNIQTINVDFTGNTSTLDVRFADSLKNLSINKITSDAGNVAFNNIGQPAANLTVKDSAKVGNTVAFNYIDGVLAGTTAGGNADVGSLTLSNATMKLLHVGTDVASSAKEGFETLNLKAAGNTQIKSLEAIDLENLTITGSGNLSIVNTTTQTDRVQYDPSGISIGDGLGIRKIDLSGFTGSASIDISKALGGHSDPSASGQKYYSSTVGSAGADTLWTSKDVASQSATLKDTIDGGAGVDTLKMIDAGITRTGTVVASVTNVENLEMRLQGGNVQSVSLAAFDSKLTSVTLRNEQKTGAQASVSGAFTLHDTGSALAAAGITLLHASGAGATGDNTPTTAVDTVNVRLADATGTKDTVLLNVKSDLNTSSSYDYTINLEAEKTAAGAYNGFVENLTINDNDNENNTVVIQSGNDKDGATTNATGLTGTITLASGALATAGKTYVVNSTLVASVVDASTQISDLTLTVGKADQTIKLGTGSDTLTFDGVDTFNGSDKLSDAGGTDTVRAAFSKDVTGTPELTGIEKLHIVATDNTAIDLIKGQAISELAILSAQAVDAANEIFSTAVSGVAVTDIITLKNTKLDTVNFFGDADGTAFDGIDKNTTKDSGAYTQTFNGLTLENNTGDTVAVKIAAPLSNGTDSVSAGDGIKNYNLGQLTTHGVKNLSISVANEYMADGVKVDASTVKTTISNIWDRDLVNLTLSAKGSVDVGTVTGNTVNSNIKVFDATDVGGNVSAIVKALGDGAVVTLKAGDDTFNALGSAGNNVVIHGGDGKNNIIGTAQSDYIDTGAGNDTIDANRGNNTIKSGAGDDTISTLNGSNTIDVGSGNKDVVTLKYDTDAQRDLATNVIAGSGTSAIVTFDSATDSSFGFAVGNGAELSVKFTGITFDQTASTLNGRSAVVSAGNAFAPAEANLSNLQVAVTAGGVDLGTVTGGSVADVFLDLRNATADADIYNVTTGAGNDAIVISQTNTAIHTITGGTGADRIILSAVAGVDTLVYAEGDSTIAGRDLVTNFHTTEDKIDVSTIGAIGTGAHLTSVVFNAAAAVSVVVDGAGYVTLSSGANDITASNIDAVLNFLAAQATTSNDVYFVTYDSNGDGLVNATDNTVLLQNLNTKLAIEFVGAKPVFADLV